MKFFKNKTTRALIIIVSALALLGISISHFYYKSINDSIDPRIVEARTLYEKYNVYAINNDFNSIFTLMDSVENIYNSVDHYRNSFEVGVLYNNRAASYLTMTIYSQDMDSIVKDSIFLLADIAVNKSIEIYEKWLTLYKDKSLVEVQQIVSNDFFAGLESYSEEKKDKFMGSRIKEIQEAQTETERRLSVAYTNLGIINRYKLQYEAAANYYKKAIDLWDKNLTAENNLNILLNRPLKKRNFIQKMFPDTR